jgi:hypothetical protein
MIPDPRFEATSSDLSIDGDPVVASMHATTLRRLQVCDPSVLGSYAEHLVATLIGGTLPLSGWGRADVVWRPNADADPVGIQVKAAHAFTVFGPEAGRPVAQLGFGLGSAHSDLTIGAETSVRASLWVFALHTSLDFRTGWWFFVAGSDAFVSAAPRRISALRLWSLLGAPVPPDHLLCVVTDCHAGRRPVRSAWPCPACSESTNSPGRLAAHLATRKTCGERARSLLRSPELA